MANDNVIQLHNLSKQDAEAYIKEISRDSGRVVICGHAKERMFERDVTRKQVIDCLQRFRFFEEPHWSLAHNNWQMTIEAQSMDDWIRIGISLNNRTDNDDGSDNYIVVITVINL